MTDELSTAFLVNHAYLPSLWEVGADAFTIMKLTWAFECAVDQRLVHPTPESIVFPVIT